MNCVLTFQDDGWFCKLHFCSLQGIEVKMITGDHLLIGKETAKMLGMGTEMYPSEVLISVSGGYRRRLAGAIMKEHVVWTSSTFESASSLASC